MNVMFDNKLKKDLIFIIIIILFYLLLYINIAF
jgi:hypothetical protein